MSIDQINRFKMATKKINFMIVLENSTIYVFITILSTHIILKLPTKNKCKTTLYFMKTEFKLMRYLR